MPHQASKICLELGGNNALPTNVLFCFSSLTGFVYIRKICASLTSIVIHLTNNFSIATMYMSILSSQQSQPNVPCNAFEIVYVSLELLYDIHIVKCFYLVFHIKLSVLCTLLCG